jgi:acyl-CoA synthetase (AMP-forming)/AMP-acid ligase II
LARGYLNNPLLTSEKFINNPFIKEGKMYKTGDIAKWTEDGDIIYLGRADNQVKLRGLRIELEEIEHYISTIDGIKDVVVLVREDEYDNQFLTAYIIREKNGMNIQAEDVKRYLTTKIPVYMIPTSFVFVSDFPLKSNGKIDKEKLKAMPQDYRNI